MPADRTPIAHRSTLGDVEIQWYDWPGDGPAIFFSHATGFHARCWDQVIAKLPEFRCIAIDMRGHGLSSQPSDPLDYRWRYFGIDVAALAREIGLKDAVAVGHSKGGHAVVNATAQAPGAFAAMLLVDPVVNRREEYKPRVEGGGEHFAARRRNEWSSVDEMVERFAGRPPFSLWEPAVLRDYCQYGLVPSPNGEGLVLACPPWIEAATYAGSAGESPYEALDQIDFPVRILRARPPAQAYGADMSSSPTPPELVKEFKDAEDFSYPEMTHFIPMQDSALVAGHVRDMAAKVTGS